MRYWKALLLLLLLPSVASALCAPEGYTIVYVNGVFTEEIKAKDDKKALEKRLIQAGRTDVTVLNGYNPTHLAKAGDLAKTFWQDGFSEEASWMDFDLQTILLNLHRDLKTQKVLLVGHSQGSYYSNELYQYLTEHGLSKDSVAVFNVGTPARFVAGGGAHLNSSRDMLLDWTESLRVFKPLYRNITIGEEATEENLDALLADAVSNWPGHSFSGAYLALAPTTVINYVENGLGNLSAQGEKEECFTPPADDLVYKAKDTFFKVADPGAIKLAQGLQAAGAGLAIAKNGVFAALGASTAAASEFFGIFVPEPRTENLAGSHTLVQKIFGSSLSEKDLIEFGLVELPAQPPIPAPQPEEQKVAEGEVRGIETEAPLANEPPPSMSSLIPPPPPPIAGGGGISPGFGGGGGASVPADSSVPAEESIPPAEEEAPSAEEEPAPEPEPTPEPEPEPEPEPDVTPPVLTITSGPAQGSTITYDQLGFLEFEATDVQSGVSHFLCKFYFVGDPLPCTSPLNLREHITFGSAAVTISVADKAENFSSVNLTFTMVESGQ